MNTTKKQKLNENNDINIINMIESNENNIVTCNECKKKLEARMTMNGINKGRYYYSCRDHGFFIWKDTFDNMKNTKNNIPNDYRIIFYLEYNRKMNPRIYKISNIMQQPQTINKDEKFIDRISPFCIENSPNQLLKKFIDKYPEHPIIESNFREKMKYYVHFRINNIKIYVVFLKLNWSKETDVKLKKYHKNGYLDYDKITKFDNFNGHDIMYDKYWIQLHGVTENDYGWLFGGTSDYIAFEIIDNDDYDFIFVNRIKLCDFIIKKCLGIKREILGKMDTYLGIGKDELLKINDSNDIYTNNPYNAYLKIFKYNICNRMDSFCYIRKEDLLSLEEKKIF